MSREIKFRAWDGQSMDFNFLVHSDGRIGEISIDEDASSSFESFGPEVAVMQYTGIKDKNGIEIYEGDILGMTLGGPLTYGQVVFEDGAFMMRNRNIASMPNLGDLVKMLRGYEVIGNTYENPELLKEKK